MSDQAFWLLCHKCKKQTSLKLLTKRDRAVIGSTVQLEKALFQVDTDNSNFGH